MTNADLPAQFSTPAQFILHPTDFAPQSEAAFAHALRLAVINKAQLTLLHVGDEADQEWDSFPAIRQTLERWDLLEGGSRRADLLKLGIIVKKAIVPRGNMAESIAGWQFLHQVDLLVMATEQRHGVTAWLKPSVAESVARKMAIPTLFVPAQGRACIALEDGHATMNSVLIPVDRDLPVGEAIERGLRAIAAFGEIQSKLILLHVGPESEFPTVKVPGGPWQVVQIIRQGDVVDEILAAAKESAANLLIMVTKGREGILDALRGTTTEQVLRQAPCPVLAVPASG